MLTAVRYSLIQQTFALLISGLALDYGMMLQICLFTVAAYWTGFLMISVRSRLHHLTAADSAFLKWGFLPLFLLAIPIAEVIWKARGS